MSEHQYNKGAARDSGHADDLARIEKLILELSERPGAITSLMREHLEAARFYLSGSMSQEYAFTLKLARQLLPEIEHNDLRPRIADFLHNEQLDQNSLILRGREGTI